MSNNFSIKIIQMRKDHYKDVAHLATQLGYPCTVQELSRRFRSKSKFNQDSLLVGILDQKVMAWMHMGEIYSLLSGPGAEIKALVVDETARSHGIGHQMILHAIQWCKKRKLRRLYLTTNITRIRTHRFYEKEGFEKSKTSFKYEIHV
jgi:GNAT superfamily N-acetyltransferase